MYFDALSFLEDEREAWRPFEMLSQLTDDELDRPVAGAHDWSGRDLMGHLVIWQQLALDVAKDLAVGERSPARERADAEWAARGDAINDEALAAWRAKSLDAVRQDFASVAGELRGFLTVVPETRWVKNADVQTFFFEETIEHYDDHAADLAAILDAAGIS